MICAAQHLEKLRRSPIRAYTDLAASVPGCVKLTIGEPDMDTPANIRAAAAAAARIFSGVSRSGSPMVSLTQPGVLFAKLV